MTHETLLRVETCQRTTIGFIKQAERLPDGPGLSLREGNIVRQKKFQF